MTASASLLWNLFFSSESQAKSLRRRRLPSHIRQYSFRKYRCFGPGQIVCGDLCFLDELQHHNSKKKIILVLIDSFSRFVSLTAQSNAKAETTLKSYRQALVNDFHVQKYDKFCSDKGMQKKDYWNIKKKAWPQVF